MKNQKPTARHLLLCAACSVAPGGALVAACSASDTSGGSGGSGSAAPQEIPADTTIPPSNEPTPAVQNLGGAPNDYGVSNPLFGAGNYSGIDLSDPCNTAPFWKVGTGIDLTTGAQVVYEGQLWEITGADAADNWAMAECTPPGTTWCADKYGWIVVKECPVEAPETP